MNMHVYRKGHCWLKQEYRVRRLLNRHHQIFKQGAMIIVINIHHILGSDKISCKNQRGGIVEY
jgi:hypothetical protein